MKLLNIKDFWEIPEFLYELSAETKEGARHLTLVPFSISGDDFFWVVISEYPLKGGVTQELFDELVAVTEE